jgi:hypothetical protein
MAMVSPPGLSALILNIVFGLKPSPIPIQSFTDDQQAAAWLKNYLY